MNVSLAKMITSSMLTIIAFIIAIPSILQLSVQHLMPPPQAHKPKLSLALPVNKLLIYMVLTLGSPMPHFHPPTVCMFTILRTVKLITLTNMMT